MKISMIKFGVAVKIGKQGLEVNYVTSNDYNISIEGMFVRITQKFGNKLTAFVCVTNIAYMLQDANNEQVSTSSVPVGDQEAQSTKAQGRKAKSE